MEFAAAAAGGRLGYDAGSAVGPAVRIALAKAGTEQPAFATANGALSGTRSEAVPEKPAVFHKSSKVSSLHDNNAAKDGQAERGVSGTNEPGVKLGRIANEPKWQRFLKGLDPNVRRELLNAIDKFSRGFPLPKSELNILGRGLAEIKIGGNRLPPARIYINANFAKGSDGFNRGKFDILSWSTNKATQNDDIAAARKILKDLKN